MNEVVVISPDSLRSLVHSAVASGVKSAIEKLAKEKNQIMDEAGASEFLAIPANTLRVWRSQGKGPNYKKVGRMIRYDKRDLEAWIKTRDVLTIDSLETRYEKSGQ